MTRGRGRDQVEIELAGEALLNDFQMQQAEEAAAEAEAQRSAELSISNEKLASLSRSLPIAFAQRLEVVRHRPETGRRKPPARTGLKPGSISVDRLAVTVGDGVADARIARLP